jgi:hypothetical protein
MSNNAHASQPGGVMDGSGAGKGDAGKGDGPVGQRAAAQETLGQGAVGEPRLVVVEPVVTAVVRGVVPMAGLRDFFDSSFRALGGTLARQQVAVLGPAFGLYHRPPGETVDLEVGFPTDRAVRTDGPEVSVESQEPERPDESQRPEDRGAPERPRGKVAVSALPAARVARTVHHGSFDGLAASWESLFAWVRAQGLTPGPVMWEVYVTEPTPEMSPDDLRTELNCVVSG